MIRIINFTAEFEELPEGGPEGLGSGRVTLRANDFEVAVWETGRIVYMSDRSLDTFVAGKFEELFDMLCMTTTSDEMEV